MKITSLSQNRITLYVRMILLALLAGFPVSGQELLLRQVSSREYSIHVERGSEDNQVNSRELSVHAENGSENGESFSREMTLAVADSAAPPALTELTVSTSPTGDTVDLDWFSYNPWQYGDIGAFRIFLSDTGPITDVTGLTPILVVDGETTSATLSGLTEFTDHFIAIVAVDALGNFEPLVNYSAAYVLSPQAVSREISLFVGQESPGPPKEVVSREFDLAVSGTNPPPALTDFAVTVSPLGDIATLDWTTYNQWENAPVDRFDIYLSDTAAISDVSGLTPFATARGGETSITLEGLATGTDHFFAIVPVDSSDNFDPLVNYAAAYVLSPQVISRELSLFVGLNSTPPFRDVVSREYDILVPDAMVPAPVTGLDSGFAVSTSSTEFGAVSLDFSSYNESAQLDVVGYDIYVGPVFFEDVTGLTPFTQLPAGNLNPTLAGLPGGVVRHFAVVAVDALGGFDPAVRSFSALTSISGVGEVINLAAVSTIDSLSFTWEAPTDAGAFLTAYRIYFGSDPTPIELPVSTLNYDFVELDAATGYPFRIATVDVFGNESSGVSLQASTLLPNPEGLFLTVQDGQLVLFWSPVQPTGLVQFYEVYQSSTPITDVTGLTPAKVSFGASAILGSLEILNGQHFAVTTVNSLGASSPLVTSVQATKQTQSISFSPISSTALQATLDATATSGLPVRFEASPANVATVQGNLLTATRGGTVVVDAYQDGDATYWPAQAVQSHRFPPVINLFAAEGTPLVDGSRIIQDLALLTVTALDADGIAQAEFFGKTPAESTYTSLALDNTPTNGLSTILPVSALPEGAYDLRVTVTTPNGFSSTRDVQVVLAAQPVLAITIDSMVIEGDSLTGNLSIGRPRATELLVTLASSHPTRLDAGPPLIFAPGISSQSFTVQALNDELPSNLLNATLTASAPEALNASAPIVVTDDDLPVLTLTLDRTATLETAGPRAILATLTRDRTTPGPLAIALTNSDNTALVVPSRVTFPSSAESVSFAIGAIDNALVDGTRFVDVQALLSVSGATLSTSNTATIEVGDDEGPVLTLAADPTWILESSTREVTLTRNAADLTSALPVALQSTNSTRVSIPAGVTIPSGSASTTFTVTGTDDGLISAQETFTITATAPLNAPGVLPLVVSDIARPDFVVSSVAAPAEVDTEASFQVSYTLTNKGGIANDGPVTQRVFLSSDPIPSADDLLLSQDSMTVFLDPNESVVRNLSVRAPQRASQSYLIVTADAPGDFEEFFEQNNSTSASSPTNIVPAYSALVEVANTVSPANQLIFFNGTATKRNGAPAPFVEVKIHLRKVGDLTRIISTTTLANGTFNRPWSPLPNEGGVIEIGATHPGVDGFTVQDSFEIIALDAQGIPSAPLTFDAGSGQSFTASLSNPSANEITGLGFAIAGAPAGLNLTVTPSSSSIPAGGSIDLLVEVDADGSFSGNENVTVTITNDQGVTYEVELDIRVRALSAQLIIEPRQLRCSVLRGSQKNPEFKITNVGGIETGPVEVALPGLEFLSLATVAPLPSLAAGASTNVTLNLTPSDLVPLSLYEGALAVTPTNGAAVTVPFGFRVVSNLTGTLEIDVVDEYYYFTPEAPKVEGAQVVVRDAITADEVATFETGVDGTATFPNLTEGWYQVEVSAADHVDWKDNIYIEADETITRQAFISRELVTYTWTVEETEIVDRYNIEVETIFETNVPAPVVTVTPNKLDLTDLETLGQTKVVNFIIENHGLINAETGSFNFGSHPFYEITPLIENVGTLPAKSSLVIPVTVKRVGVFDENDDIVTLPKASPTTKDLAAKANKAASVPCSISGGYRYTYKCGPNGVEKGVPVAVSGAQGRCGGGGSINPTGQPGGGGIFARAVSFTSRSFCDCPPFFGSERCIGAEGSVSLPGVVGKVTSALAKVLPAGIKIQKVDFKLNGKGELCICCKDGQYDIIVKGSASLDVKVELFWGISAPSIPASELSVAGWSNIKVGLSASVGVTGTVTGSIKLERKKECLGESDTCISGSLSGTISAGPKASGSISATQDSTGITFSGSASADYTATANANVTAQWCDSGGGSVKACASAKIGGSIKGKVKAKVGAIFVDESLSIPLPSLLDEKICTGDDKRARRIPLKKRTLPNKADGEPDFLADALPEPIDFSEDVVPDSQLLDIPEVQELLPENSDGVCARVKVKISQEAVTTRTAFRASLELTNNLPEGDLTQVGFELDVRDQFNLPAGENFNIRVSKLTGLTAIDGTGTIPAEGTGSAQWTLIPRDTAAPLSDTLYLVGGTITYNQNGVLLSVPVDPALITVRPDAALSLKYFHQRDVISDDPFTDNLELPEPYYLAVQVCNTGAGAARDLSITSAQPEIVENDKGLLIDFKINSTTVDDLPTDASLAANFGDIQPGEKKTAVWEMESSLQGLFIDYKATFTHLDGFDDPRISLLKEIEIHEMIRLIDALGSKDDGKPDFLTNDIPDLDDYPDTIHLSDGSVEPVTLLESANVTGGTTTRTLSFPAQNGWTYLRIPDPAQGNFALTNIVRSDGLVIPVGGNAWTSDRTFIGLGQRPLLENIFHLVDCDSTGIYTLEYSEVSNEDTLPPDSFLKIIPGTLGSEIALNWTGTDVGTGIAFYDIYVAVDGASPELWLAQTRQTAALYSGLNGVNYAFYSIATDRAGNVEAAPAQPDAATLLNTDNLAPVLAFIPDQAVTEGGTVSLRASATDPDGARAALRFSVASPATGVTIDAVSGALTFVTGEGDGGRTVSATVTVTDAGSPASSTSQAFTITINPLNTPPVIAEIPPQSVEVGGYLIVDANATDADAPAQTLAWSLGAGAPEGMTIDSQSGLIIWTPGSPFSGETLSVPIVVTDSGIPAESTTADLAISVAVQPDRPPSFNLLPLAIWTEGRSFTLDIFATDADGDPLSLAANLAGTAGASFDDQGDGSGSFTWDTSGASQGNYRIPITASAEGATTGGFIDIQIKDDNLYWNWAIEEIGEQFSDPATIADIEPSSNPDGDRLSNLYEMAYLTDPNVPDSPDIELRAYDRIGPFGRADIRIYRRKGSQEFVKLTPQSNRNLEGEWQTLSPLDWSSEVDADGDDDDRPESEALDFSIFEFFPTESPDKYFFRIEGNETSETP